jgi:hypothetical protein
MDAVASANIKSAEAGQVAVSSLRRANGAMHHVEKLSLMHFLFHPTEFLPNQVCVLISILVKQQIMMQPGVRDLKRKHS